MSDRIALIHAVNRRVAVLVARQEGLGREWRFVQRAEQLMGCRDGELLVSSAPGDDYEVWLEAKRRGMKIREVIT